MRVKTYTDGALREQQQTMNRDVDKCPLTKSEDLRALYEAETTHVTSFTFAK